MHSKCYTVILLKSKMVYKWGSVKISLNWCACEVWLNGIASKCQYQHQLSIWPFFFGKNFHFWKKTPSEWKCNENLSIAFKTNFTPKITATHIKSQINNKKTLAEYIELHSVCISILLNVHLGSQCHFERYVSHVCECLCGACVCLRVTVHWIAVCFKIKASIYFNSK